MEARTDIGVHQCVGVHRSPPEIELLPCSARAPMNLAPICRNPSRPEGNRLGAVPCTCLEDFGPNVQESMDPHGNRLGAVPCMY